MAGLEDATAAFQEDLSPGSVKETGERETIFTPRIDESEEPGGDRAGGEDGREEVRFRARKAKSESGKRKREPDPDEGDDQQGVDPEYPDLDEQEEDPDADENQDENEDENEELEARAKKEGDKEDEDLDLDRTVKVTVDGKEAEVPLKEALNGYIRMETFHQRLNQVNEARKTIEGEAHQVNQAREVYINMLQTLKGQLDSLTPAEPNWVEEYKRDPVAASKAQEQWQQFKTQRQALDEQQRKAHEELTKEQSRLHQEWVKEQNRLTMVVIPEWNDRRKLNVDRQRIYKTAKAAGFSDQEVAGVIDARYLVVLRKAALYDAMQAQNVKGKGAGNQVRRQETGPRPRGGTVSKQASKAAARLNRTGSLHDAARAFELELAHER